MASITVDFVAVQTGRVSEDESDLRFFDKTICSGITPISYSWVFSNGLTSTKQNPVITCPDNIPVDIDVTLTVTGSDDSTGTLTKTAYINEVPFHVTKPTETDTYKHITIFVYDATTAMALSRAPNSMNNLFYKDLVITGSMNLPGQAKFTVYSVGAYLGTATEKALICANKNIAIIAGNGVVWSGKILKATQEKQSLYATTSPYQSWDVVCESDITKMKNQNVKPANKGVVTGPIGYIISKIVENSEATDINWNGASTDPGIISYDGASISYTITDADMYTQMLALANMSGYDWRTRLTNQKYVFTSYTSGAFNVADIAPYTTNSFLNKWVLVVESTGVKMFGLCTGNTTTTISCPIGGGFETTYIIVLGDPVLDFCTDLRNASPVATFSINKARASTVQNAYEMNDKSDFKNIYTKIVTRGKRAQTDGTLKTVVGSLVAKDKWNEEELQFDNTSYITYCTEADVYKVDTIGSYYVTVLRGAGTWHSGDTVFITYCVSGVWSIASKTVIGVFNWNGLYGEELGDRTPTTVIHLNSAVRTAGTTKIINSKVYIKDPARITQAGDYTYLNIGFEQTTRKVTNALTGYDPVYGNYMKMASTSDLTPENVLVHGAGCPVSNNTNSEASPEALSPITYFGLITNTQTVDQGISDAVLETYAISLLNYYAYYYKKASVWCFINDYYKDDIRYPAEVTNAGWIREGDRIACLQNQEDSIDDMQYGMYKNRYQVIQWVLDANRMTVSLELGDQEKNVFTMINEKVQSLDKTIT
jgi:hypothetical protein